MKTNKLQFNQVYSKPLELLKAIKDDACLPILEINLIGSRKSGKTYNMMLIIILICINAKVLVLFTRGKKAKVKDTYNQLMKILNRHFKSHIIKTLKDAEVVLANGSLIQLRSFGTQKNNEEKLTGLADAKDYSYVIDFRDEVSETELEDIQWLEEAMRGYEDGRLLTINTSNPWLITHWKIGECDRVLPFDANKLTKYKIQELWDEKTKKYYLYTNWYHNQQFLSQQEIDKLLRTIEIDPIRAKVSVFGMPGAAKGAIYSHLLHKVKDTLDFIPFEYCIGVDYGQKKDKTIWSLWATDREYKNFICLESCEHDNTTEVYLDSFGLAYKICGTVKRWLKEHWLLRRYGCELFFDNSNLSFGDMIIKKLIQMNILNITPLESVKIPILLRVGQWKTIMGLRHFYITQKANGLYKELQNSIWDPNSLAQYKRLDKDDHHINAGEYALQKWLGNEDLSL